MNIDREAQARKQQANEMNKHSFILAGHPDQAKWPDTSHAPLRDFADRRISNATASSGDQAGRMSCAPASHATTENRTTAAGGAVRAVALGLLVVVIIHLFQNGL